VAVAVTGAGKLALEEVAVQVEKEECGVPKAG